ncbi:unnamed protein product [Prunus armeniaca]
MIASDAPGKKELGILQKNSAQRQSFQQQQANFFVQEDDGVGFGSNSLPATKNGWLLPDLTLSLSLSHSEFVGGRKRKNKMKVMGKGLLKVRIKKKEKKEEIIKEEVGIWETTNGCWNL